MKTSIVPALFALLFSASVHAEPVKMAILPFTGPKGSVPRVQLAETLCPELECVVASKVGRGPRPDFKRAKRAGVDLIFTGRVSGSVTKRVLTLNAWGADGRKLSTETYRLARNAKLSRSDLDEARAKALALAEWFNPPAPKAEPDPVIAAQPRLVPEPAPETSPGEASSDAEASPAEVPEEVTQRVTPEKFSRSVPLFWVEAGAEMTNRNFSYAGLQVPNLRAYVTQPALFAPRLRGAVYPLAAVMDGIVAGLGIEAGYAFAVGLNSVDEREQRHPTTATRLDFGARLDVRPVTGSALMISPQLGYRSAVFAVGPAADGTRLAGMPDLRYEVLRAGVEAEIPVDAMRFFGGVHYLHALSLGEIGAEPYFPKSSGGGWEASVGGGYRVTENVELRLSVNYTRYGLAFEAAPSATYVADGAGDQYVGGVLGARFVY